LLYKIADLTVKIDTFGTAAKRAEKYLCDSAEMVDFELVSPWEKSKHLHPNLSDDVGEYMALGAKFYDQLLKFNGFMLHSSAVVVDSKAYLFTADSGTGKSTHTENWLKFFGEKAFILNDDKPALRFVNGKWYAFGTPWSGKHDLSENIGVEVAGIAVLRRAETNSINKFSGIKATAEILKQVNKPSDAKSRIKVLELLDKLVTNVPVWQLDCNKEIDSARLAYEAMSGYEPKG
jgi:hypothetical protein